MKPISFDTVETDPQRVAVTNGAGSACPAFGLARPTGGGDDATYTIGQPNVDGGFAWVNGPFQIAAGGGGAVHATGPFYALYDSGDGTPAVGEMWGAGNGSWKLKKNKAGFRVVGDPDTSVTLVPVERVSLSSPLTTKGDLWGFSTVDARIPVGTNTYVLTADSAETLGVKWSAVAGSGLVDGDYGDITVSGAATTWTIDNGVVTDAKFRDSAALSVVGRSANSSGSVADIAAGTDDYVLRRSGTSLGFGQVATGGITDAAVTDAKLRESAALSVVGRSANSTGVPADITAGTEEYVLRRSGSTLAFGQVATGGITDAAVTYAKIQDVSAASRLLGRGSASGSGDVEEITLGSNLSMTGTTLSATGGVSDGDKGDITVSSSGATWTIDNSAVTYAKMQNVSTTNRILGRVTSGSGVVEELTAANVLVILGFPSGTGGAGPRWMGPFVVTYADVAIAASNTNIEIYSLPAGCLLTDVVLRCTAAFSGGALTGYGVSVGLEFDATKYHNQFDVFSGAYDSGNRVSPDVESFASPTSIRLHATATSDTLDNVTAGSVTVWLLVSQLP